MAFLYRLSIACAAPHQWCSAWFIDWGFPVELDVGALIAGRRPFLTPAREIVERTRHRRALIKRGVGTKRGIGGGPLSSAVLAASLAITTAAHAQRGPTPSSQTPTPGSQTTVPAAPQTTPAPVAGAADCSVNPDPYKNYACLDTYLGDNVAVRLYNYYRLEWGQSAAPAAPTAPRGRRADGPATPETTPPMPFTEWPYGGATSIGVNRPNSVDSPFMNSIANTGLGKLMNDLHIQLYGWVDGGFNISTNSRQPAGNAPIGYAYTPNTIQLDQAVLYLERTPDTVQTDHVDWGFRLSAIYGENYRYTTSYGLASYQLLKRNNINGYDFPMLYGEVYIPQVAQGLLIRAGRYISLPDIEAQLAPNNYMYTHSLSYTYDNYTNTGIVSTLALTKNLIVQFGISDGTETALDHIGDMTQNFQPGNALYSGNSFKKDPGNQPTYTACIRYTWNQGNDNVYPCVNGINRGNWGYNNLNWYGGTYYHKFNDHWHISLEGYYEYQQGVPNANNPQAVAIYQGGGTPFSPQFIPFNSPNLAQCKDPNALRCRAAAVGVVGYLNYSPDPLNNFSFRPEYYDDQEGQRTGVKATYYEFTVGWQHWFSPQLEVRPEVGYWEANRNVFNGSPSRGIGPNKNHTFIGAADLIAHF